MIDINLNLYQPLQHISQGIIIGVVIGILIRGMKWLET